MAGEPGGRAKVRLQDFANHRKQDPRCAETSQDTEIDRQTVSADVFEETQPLRACDGLHGPNFVMRKGMARNIMIENFRI